MKLCGSQFLNQRDARCLVLDEHKSCFMQMGLLLDGPIWKFHLSSKYVEKIQLAVFETPGHANGWFERSVSLLAVSKGHLDAAGGVECHLGVETFKSGQCSGAGTGHAVRTVGGPHTIGAALRSLSLVTEIVASWPRQVWRIRRGRARATPSFIRVRPVPSRGPKNYFVHSSCIVVPVQENDLRL